MKHVVISLHGKEYLLPGEYGGEKVGEPILLLIQEEDVPVGRCVVTEYLSVYGEYPLAGTNDSVTSPVVLTVVPETEYRREKRPQLMCLGERYFELPVRGSYGSKPTK